VEESTCKKQDGRNMMGENKMEDTRWSKEDGGNKMEETRWSKLD